MKKTKIWALAAPLLLIACTDRTSPEDVAGAAAKTYYQQLAKEQYAEYVDGFYRPDSIPTHYRQQLIENAKMFLAEQTRERGSLAGVHLTRATVDTALHRNSRAHGATPWTVVYALSCAKHFDTRHNIT